MRDQQLNVEAPAEVGQDSELLLNEMYMHILPTVSASLAQHSLSKLCSIVLLMNIIGLDVQQLHTVYSLTYADNSHHSISYRTNATTIIPE